jgi:hypothetical protein
MFAARIVAGTLDDAGVVDLPNVYVLDSNGIPVAPGGVLSDEAEYEYVKDADTADIDYIRASLLFEPNDTFDALLTYAAQQDKGRRPHANRLRAMMAGGDPYGDYQNGSISASPASAKSFSLSRNELRPGLALVSSTSGQANHDGSSTSENTGFYAKLAGWARFTTTTPGPWLRGACYDNQAHPGTAPRVQGRRAIRLGARRFLPG